jgi:starch phosphorylase
MHEYVAATKSQLLVSDRYMHLADLKSYLEADQRMRDWYANPRDWARKAVLNVASSGRFSSDRSITEYAKDIWGAKACPVSSRDLAHE